MKQEISDSGMTMIIGRINECLKVGELPVLTGGRNTGRSTYQASETRKALSQLLETDDYPNRFKIRLGEAIIVLDDYYEIKELLQQLRFKLLDRGYTVSMFVDPTVQAYEFTFDNGLRSPNPDDSQRTNQLQS